MDTTTSVLLTSILVIGGRWSDPKSDGVTVRLVVGALLLAIILAVVDKANPKLAGQFATLVLVTAVFMYGPKVIKALGVSDK